MDNNKVAIRKLRSRRVNRGWALRKDQTTKVINVTTKYWKPREAWSNPKIDRWKKRYKSWKSSDKYRKGGIEEEEVKTRTIKVKNKKREPINTGQDIEKKLMGRIKEKKFGREKRI